MSKKDIIDYVMETPGNTNKKVLGRLIDEVEGVKLPEVTEDDNGDVLTVVEGVWDKAEPSGGSGGETIPVLELPTAEGSSISADVLNAIFVPNTEDDVVTKYWPSLIRIKCERPLSHGHFDAVLALSCDGFQYIYACPGVNAGGSVPFRFLYYRNQGMNLQSDTANPSPDQNFTYQYSADDNAYHLQPAS